jgi:hypothetical protein
VTVFHGKTDSAGAFVAPQVIPGTYKITVSAAGLKDAVIDNLVATRRAGGLGGRQFAGWRGDRSRYGSVQGQGVQSLIDHKFLPPDAK